MSDRYVRKGAPLCPSELEVLQMLCRGLLPKQIATARMTSLGTARSCINRIKLKAGIRSHYQLCAWGVLSGYVTDCGVEAKGIKVVPGRPHLTAVGKRARAQA